MVTFTVKFGVKSVMHFGILSILFLDGIFAYIKILPTFDIAAGPGCEISRICEPNRQFSWGPRMLQATKLWSKSADMVLLLASGGHFMTKLARPRFFGAYLQKVPTINDFGIFRF